MCCDVQDVQTFRRLGHEEEDAVGKELRLWTQTQQVTNIEVVDGNLQ